MFYYVGLLLIWSVRELIVRPIFDIDLGIWQDAAVSTVVKVLVWTVPALLLIKHYEEYLYVPLKKMLSIRIKWAPYIATIAGLFLYHVIGAYITFGRIGIHEDFHLSSLPGVVLFVGITEEAVFRAWLLNATYKKERAWQAILLNSLLFVGIHFPIWIHRGIFSNPNVLWQNVSAVLILSIIFGWSFVKSKSIHVPIIIHMCWNLFDIIFFGT